MTAAASTPAARASLFTQAANTAERLHGILNHLATVHVVPVVWSDEDGGLWHPDHVVEFEEDITAPCDDTPSDHYIELEEEDETEHLESRLRLAALEQTWLTSFCIEDVASAPATWISPGFLMPGMATLLTGAPGSGKSLLALGAAVATANGGRFLDFQHEARPVLYLDRENPLPVLQKRWAEFGIKRSGWLRYIGLFSPNGVPAPGVPEKKIDHVARFVDFELARTGFAPLIVIDSFVRFIEGNENSTEDVARFWNRMAPLKAAGCAFLILHHTGKGETSQDSRGSMDITAGCDFHVKAVKSSGSEDETKRLQKIQLHVKRTRFPGDGLPLKSVVVLSNGVWSYAAASAVKAKESPEDGTDRLLDIFKAHPDGVGSRQFREAASSLKVSRDTADRWLGAMVANGTITTRRGNKNAVLHFLAKPSTAT